MRFRNIKPKGDKIAGNFRTSLTGRDVRSRLFASMDMGPRFSMPDLGPAPKILRLVQEDGTESPQEWPDPVEWELPDPVPPLSDAQPPTQGPLDVRPGGADRPESLTVPPARTFTVTGATTSHALNVTAPSAANCAQVLSALLQDLQRRGDHLVKRVEA